MNFRSDDWTLTTVALALELVVGARADAYCSPEVSPCYRYDHYVYQGAAYCRRWNDASSDLVYLMGAEDGIDPYGYYQGASSAYSEWANNVYGLPSLTMTVSDPSDTTMVSYVLFIDNATWTAQGHNPNAAGVTFLVTNQDGTVAHGRTWLHDRPGVWRWSPDCTSENCTAGFPPGIDLPSIMTHEFGHWLTLGDISTTGCESVIMWRDIALAQVKRTLAFEDAQGATLLYDQPTSVLYPLAASPGPTADTLRWEDPYPSPSNEYDLGVSDACWGPFAPLASVAYGDPSATSDGIHYTYVSPAQYWRPYSYELKVPAQRGLAHATSTRTAGTVPSPPGVPGNLMASVTSFSGDAATVSISWSPSSGTVTAYYLYRDILHMTDCGVRDQAPWDILEPSTSTNYVDSSPPVGDSVFYRVRAVNTTGGSGLSTEAGVYLGQALGVGDEPRAVDNGLRLVWPNPSRGSMNVRYTLVSAGRVRINVFDIVGRRVATIVDEMEAAGEHRAVWRGIDAGGAPSSVFFVKLFLDGKPVGEQRMTVLR